MRVRVIGLAVLGLALATFLVIQGMSKPWPSAAAKVDPVGEVVDAIAAGKLPRGQTPGSVVVKASAATYTYKMEDGVLGISVDQPQYLGVRMTKLSGVWSTVSVAGFETTRNQATGRLSVTNPEQVQTFITAALNAAKDCAEKKKC